MERVDSGKAKRIGDTGERERLTDSDEGLSRLDDLKDASERDR